MRSKRTDLSKTSDGNCQSFRKTALTKENLGIAITISGHITHQNGVRMSGVTLTLKDLDKMTQRTVTTDETGNYLFGNLIFGARYELIPSGEGYQFFPPSIIWEGIVDDQIMNFVAAGPAPEEPPVPPGTPTLAWTSFYNNPANSEERNPVIGRDAQGNIYLGGSTITDENSFNRDMVVSKIDPNGNLLWSKTFNGSANSRDDLTDMAVDASGNVYAAGFSYSTSPTLSSYDYAILKYDTNGNLLWSKTYGRQAGFDDAATSLKIDVNGNVYVTGYSWDTNVFADFATLKFDTNGNQLWVKRFSTVNGDGASEIEVDAAGNVYVTGTSQNGIQGGSEDILTVKYDAAGNQLWQNRYNAPSDDSDEGYELEIDGVGNVYVIGAIYELGADTQTFIQKINGATGNNIWTKNYTVADSFGGTVPTAMELDPQGNIVIAGMTSLTDEFYNADVFTAKFDSAGVFQWVKTYDGLSDQDYDGDTKLALDSNGNIYIGASSAGFYNADMQFIKYSPDGAEIWRFRYGNPFFEYDALTDAGADVAQTTMIADNSGNLYVAGESFIPQQGTNMVALKLEPANSLRAVPFDFDGDKKADVAVYRPETGVWYVLNSSDGSYSIVNWGLSGDKLVPADFDGDGKTDLGVYRNGTWYVQKSSGGHLINQFGLSADKPVPSDFDNDGKADLGVFRQGVWHRLGSSDGSYKAFLFGLGTDTPLPSDYDKNRRSDVAVFRNGSWFVNYQAELTSNSFQFGLGTDKPVPADYDGDQQTDYAVFRNGVWYVWQSRSNALKAFQWGISNDVPVPADYDGDKKTDFAVYRNGVWHIWRSSNNSYASFQFGLATDIPIPAAYSR